MAKTLVVAPGEQPAKVPFLRGIMIRSLQDAGLPFAEAYDLATAIRDELAERTEITTSELHHIVVRHLSGQDTKILQRYQHPASITNNLFVIDSEGHSNQFSREQHRRLLETSGLSYEESTLVTTAIYSHLMKRGASEISTARLGMITYRYLRLTLGDYAAARYLVLVNFLHQDRPIVIMIGGAPGTGKSAVATEIAQRLGIVRSQSTDMLREVMRMMIPERLMPVLHRSSYDAWRALPGKNGETSPTPDLLIDGFWAQTDLLSVPCEAVMRRSLLEGTSLIIEGIHVQEKLMEHVPADSEAIAIPVFLAVPHPETLRNRFRGRGEQVHARRAERYLENFDAIWQLQSYLLAEADRQRIPIVVNYNREQVVREVIFTIVTALSEEFTASPDEVFR